MQKIVRLPNLVNSSLTGGQISSSVKRIEIEKERGVCHIKVF